MARFRIKLKLQGLELEVEGSREDAPLIARSIEKQFAGLLAPAAAVVVGEFEELPPNDPAKIHSTASAAPPKRAPRKKKTLAGTTSSADGVDETPVDWRHDPAKWGSLRQSWTTANNAIWLLLVAASETPHKELSAKRLANTFNKHFKQAGQILHHNVSRDLGKQKIGKDAPVSEDTTQLTSPWFLTESGTRRAQALVAEAQGRENESAAGASS